MNTTPPKRRRRTRRFVTRLAVGVLVAVPAVVVATPPAQAADESIAVNFSVAGTYQRRWNSTLAQARRTIALGGVFILLPHDLWGADGFPIARFPGDNGNWTDYDNFLTRVISDVRAAGLTVQWDIWNEPNITLFWNRPQAQYFELWRRTYQRIRAEFPNHLIVGPSCACVPSTTHAFWNQYLDFVRANNLVPDIISWHSLPGDPVANVAAANATLDPRGIPHPRPYQINEYAAPSEQNPGDGSWYIARLERAGADGLCANWASGGNLHDHLADLLLRNSAGQHLPKGEWWVYRFYGSQTGQITSVTPSVSYDAFATKAPGVAKVLVGGGGTTGNIAVNLQRLDTTSGIVQNNQVRVVAQRIPYNNGGAVQGPITIQNSVVTLANNSTTVNLPHTNSNDTFTLTLLPPSEGGFQSVAVAQHSQQCLDNTNLSAADGNVQQQFYCEGGDQQLWDLRPVAGVANTYTIVNQQSGKCLDVNGVSTTDGAPVIQWTCHAGLHQQFTLRKVTYPGNDPHDYQLVARHSGKCVDVSTISTAPRAPIHQWTCNPAGQGSPLNQTWRIWGR